MSKLFLGFLTFWFYGKTIVALGQCAISKTFLDNWDVITCMESTVVDTLLDKIHERTLT